MRTLTIYRPKCMEASLCKLIVEIDGQPVGKLANGKDISATIDENAHELHLHGGKLAGKNFAVNMTIPAGGFSYTLQTNMLDVTAKIGNSNYQPILLPCGNAPKQHASRVIQLMVATLTNALMDRKAARRAGEDSRRAAASGHRGREMGPDRRYRDRTEGSAGPALFSAERLTAGRSDQRH